MKKLSNPITGLFGLILFWIGSFLVLTRVSGYTACKEQLPMIVGPEKTQQLCSSVNALFFIGGIIAIVGLLIAVSSLSYFFIKSCWIKNLTKKV